MSARRPNLLIIMADQMSGLALPSYGQPTVKAPHLTALADEGVLFENAYCNSPLCAPSRAAMMTGQRASRTGTFDNAAEFPAETPTFGHYLREAGYRTVLCGKMHFVGPDQLHGFEERLTTDIYPADFGWTPDWERPEHRPSWYHNMLSVVQAGLCETSNQLDFDEEVAFHAGRKLYDMARGGDERPFCFVVSFTHPHDPFAVPQTYWDRYDYAAIDMPKVPAVPVDQLDPHSRRVHHVCGLHEYAQTAERVRAARHAYYSMISYVDDKVGQLMQTLAATGLADDTIVVFTSDHGEMLGERGLWYKMSFFDPALRVPLIVHAPGRYTPRPECDEGPRRVSQNVSLVDLLPTLLDLADEGRGSNLTAEIDGRSLAPLLRGETGAWPDTVLAEILCEGAIAPCLMIRRGCYKYIYSEPDPDQLYDLATDPDELENLAGRPEYEEVHRAFRAEILTHWDPEALRARVLASQHRRRLVDRALRTGRNTPWDFQPFVDASQQYMRNHLDLNDLERRARYPTPPIPAPDFPNSA